jgi:hypothetical protein
MTISGDAFRRGINRFRAKPPAAGSDAK